MRSKTPKLLEDIRDAAAYIGEIVQGRTLDDYQHDRMLRQAVERNFEIIGEAVSRLTRVDPDTAARIGSHRQIVDFRNVLIHGHDLIDHTHRVEHDCREDSQLVERGRVAAENGKLNKAPGPLAAALGRGVALP